ncbi:MAG: substrate-binding domain-containing protein [Kiloniellales bacterium]|nr:substrate-binding domain-containing protein [Kiloniellales bacterium]
MRASLRFISVFTAAALLILQTQNAWAERFITVASTTSTANSGLFDHLLPAFEKQTGIKVHVVAVGTGQALRIARNGDADVLFVHHRPSEESFVNDGFGVKRFDVMYNDFVIAGPSSDPAGVKGMEDAAAALQAIAEKRATFVSRGDDSGTHKKELFLWEEADLDPSSDSGKWYREVGAGMGATLNTAAAMDGYTLTDRGTWMSFENRRELEILVAGDERLFNPYGVILVNKDLFPHIKDKDGQAFIDWLTSSEGQKLIAAYRISGEQLFFPNANQHTSSKQSAVSQ